MPDLDALTYMLTVYGADSNHAALTRTDIEFEMRHHNRIKALVSKVASNPRYVTPPSQFSAIIRKSAHHEKVTHEV